MISFNDKTNFKNQDLNFSFTDFPSPHNLLQFRGASLATLIVSWPQFRVSPQTPVLKNSMQMITYSTSTTVLPFYEGVVT